MQKALITCKAMKVGKVEYHIECYTRAQSPIELQVSTSDICFKLVRLYTNICAMHNIGNNIKWEQARRPLEYPQEQHAPQELNNIVLIETTSLLHATNFLPSHTRMSRHFKPLPCCKLRRFLHDRRMSKEVKQQFPCCTSLVC